MSKTKMGDRKYAGDGSGVMPSRTGKAGYPKAGPKGMAKLEGPGCQDDCSGPGGGKGEGMDGEHG